MKKQGIVYILSICLFAVLAAAIAWLLVRCGTAAEAGGGRASDFPVYISEIMASNGSYYDHRGNTYDWIELHNRADIAIDLGGYKLTDSERTVRYVFPSGARIEPDGYYVVYCRRNGGEGYADFSIAKAGGEPIVLMNKRSVIIDRVVTLPLAADQVMARTAEGEWRVLDYGTPGYVNSEAGYAAYREAMRGELAVRINELMSDNESYCDAQGIACDWIELYNASAQPVSLAGCRLTDRAGAEGYVFPPDTVIEAGEYLLVYCDGDVSDGSRAPFSLASAGGESLSLATSAGVVLDQLITPKLMKDHSYARAEDGAWAMSGTPSPGYENSAEGYRRYLEAARELGGALRITELMASNRSCLMDAYGQFSDWIELCNTGDTALSLQGFCLSDNPANPAKWALPDIELPAGGRLVVFASGKDCLEGGEAHTNFSLNRHAGVLLLRAPSGQTLDRVEYAELDDNISYRLDEASGQWGASRLATPGYPNDEQGYEGFMASLSAAGPLVISEVMTGNDSLLKQGLNLYYDWVELMNVSDHAVELSEYSLSDNLDKTARAALPRRRLAPGERVLLMCTNMELARCTHAQISLSLNAQNDSLFLLDAGGAVIDRLWLCGIPYNGSCGKMPAQNGQFYFSTPTPEKENLNGCRLVSASPAASVAPGVYEGITEMTLALSAAGAIRYTLDGSMPTEDSAVYEAPIPLSKTSVVRAVAYEAGKLASTAMTWSYIINEGHGLPVVSVVTDGDNLYDDRIGILAPVNWFDRSVERPAHISYFNGAEQFVTDCGLKLHGAGSRGRIEKKSFKVTFRPRYGGMGPLDFPLFEDSDTRLFHSILLRNSQDYKRGYMRDEIVTWIACRSSAELLVQDTRYCVLYLNGEYWGLYCIKEAYSSGYFAERFGVDKESVEMQRGFIAENSPFREIIDYAIHNDLNKPENYRYIADRVNIESMIDWCIYEAYSANTDLSINVRYLRSPQYDDNRWQYALFDLDCGFSFPATYDYLLKDSWHGALFRALISNPEFQDLYLRRMADQLENYLTPEAVLARYEYLYDQIEGEMPREMARWHTQTPLNWEGHQKKLRYNLSMDRAEQLKAATAKLFRIPLSKVEAYFS